MALTEVNSLGIKDLEVKTADIAADAVTAAKIADDAVGAEHIEVLDANLQLADDSVIQLGTSNEAELYHNSSGATVFRNTADAKSMSIQVKQNSNITFSANDTGSQKAAVFKWTDAATPVSSAELYQGDTKRFETTATGVTITGDLDPAADSSHDLGSSGVRWQNGYFDTLYGDGSNLTNLPAGGATINNATANELVTVASTTTQLDAEANLTFDGNDLTLGDGNIIFAAGHGIDFSAQSDSSASGTSTSAELLSHYEEGTWTPEINGSDGGDYTMGSSNNGHYTRVGALVFCSCTLHWSSRTTAYTGMAVINGLPFQNNGARSAVTFGPYSTGSLVPDIGDAGYRHQNGVLDPGQSRIYPTEQQEDGGYGHGPIVGTSGIIYGITVVYETDAAN